MHTSYKTYNVTALAAYLDLLWDLLLTPIRQNKACSSIANLSNLCFCIIVQRYCWYEI